MIVTAVERKRGRVSVFVDGEPAIEIGATLASERGVTPGRAITTEELAELEAADQRRRAMDSAVRLLSYRQRGVHELRDRLGRKGIHRVVVEATIKRLKELGYLDDAAFARSWTETRLAASPRSSRLLASELRLKGIAPQVASDATSNVSDEEAAYRAASGRLRSLKALEYRPFRERLGRFLTSRGFGYGVAKGTIDRCWTELHGDGEDVDID